MIVGTVKTKGAAARYARFGEGDKTAVILPGLSVRGVVDSAAAVARDYAALAADFTVFLLDRVDDPEPPYTPADMARDVADALDALGLSRVCLFGASQGGMIAMCVAAERPDLVEKLALASTAVKATETARETLAGWVRLAKARDGEALCLDFGEKVYPAQLFLAYRDALRSLGGSLTECEFNRFVTLAGGTADFDFTNTAKKISCPVLAVGSRSDAVLGADAIDGVIAAFGGNPAFESRVYTGFGHALYDLAPGFKDGLYRFFSGMKGEE